MNILEPILERHFHPDSYACRKEKGTHRAADRLQRLMGRYRYCLQCDIRKFFPTIDHEILKRTFRRLIKDEGVLWLMDLIVDCSNEQPAEMQWFGGDDLFAPIEREKGLPIGNLTSQWFANWYLNGLDHFVTCRLRMGAYVRYCDDFIILHDSRRRLKEAVRLIEAYLAGMRLKLHWRKVHIRAVRAGSNFVGYRIRATHRLLKKRNIRRFRRRVRFLKEEYARGRIEWNDVKRRLDSWLGHAKHCESKYLVKNVSKDWVFKRGETVNEPCSPRRQLEQQREQLPGGKPQQQHAIESQQQHRISCRPALSNKTVNQEVYGFPDSGSESPGFIPVPRAARLSDFGQINVERADESGKYLSLIHI